ncbi:hypothetical protein Hypma_008480 [Hypsizygus marmoreus]|uniref:MATE efflux family protein n=1 Tax=Hypsizygus marmoreus TaxID=39966 RepID=A0A369JVU9_HYPMA|nr:hypothetical protein Hypma_008480 [Hypsizygus marmoreus]
MSSSSGPPLEPHHKNKDPRAEIATETTALLTREYSEDAGLDSSDTKDVSTATMFWQEMRTIPTYALPVFSSQILEYSLVVVPVISVGHLSTKGLAAISLGSMTGSVTGYSVLQGLASALDTLLPSAYTSPEPHLVGLWAQRMAVVMTFALLPISFIWMNAERILLTLKQDPEVAHLASLYLRWLMLSLPSYSFNCIGRRYFQSQGLFAVQTRIISVVAPINVLLNYLLVWGPEPIRLGFIGAPIATAMSTWLISLSSILYAVYFIPPKAWHPFTRQMFTNLGLLVRLGVAGIGQIASEWWAWELVALAASFLGPIALASQSILITSGALTYQVPFALAMATSVRTGNLLGAKNARRAGVAANASLVVCLILSLFVSGLYMIFQKSWAQMFNNDPEVIKLVASIIPLIALYQVVDGNAAFTSGIMRAKGQQSIGAILNFTGYYMIGLPFGAWLAFSWGLGLHGLWIGLTIALVYCAVIGSIICLRTDWNKEVEKVVARIAEEDRLRKIAEEENRHLV